MELVTIPIKDIITSHETDQYSKIPTTKLKGKIFLPYLSRVKNYHQLAVTCRASSEHPEMPQVVLLLKMPCAHRAQACILPVHIVNRNTSSQPFMTPCTLQVMNRIPGDLTPSWAGCWGPPHSCSVSRAIYLPAQRNLLWHHKDICNRAHLHDKYYLWHYLIIWFNLFILQALLNGFLNFEEFDVEEYDHYEVCTLYTDLCL